MAFSINFDVRDFEAKAKQLQANMEQLPFAMSKLLNDSAFAAKRVLVDRVWPQYVTQRNYNFLNASLQITRATKGNLSVVMYDKLQRGHLYEHAHGGTVTPMRGQVFAIPVKNMVRRGARGVASRDRPRNLVSTKTKRIVVTSKGIFVSERNKLKLMYIFKPSVRINRDVPFVETFNYVVLEHMRTGFTNTLAYAMATARK
jgi:hypothetical protein